MRGDLRLSDSVLVLAGGQTDRDALQSVGFRNGVISNLAPHAGHVEYEPFSWQYLDAENLELDDDTFDWVVVHAGLHHLASPARGVCEALRVAKHGIVCIENRDSVSMRLIQRLGLASSYELESAALSDGIVGGFRNGPVPNYIYRWTEREFEKLVSSYLPAHEHTFFYEYGIQIPTARLHMSQSIFVRAAARPLAMVGRLVETIAPRQGNVFAFGVLKNTKLHPWIEDQDGELGVSRAYLADLYDAARYKRPSDT